MNPELPMTKAYEYLEKENWKQFVMDEFKPFVDALDLTAFKKLLKDPLKRHFLPR
jgi:tRNA A37 threonylcarbamoyladenosine dehydratase